MPDFQPRKPHWQDQLEQHLDSEYKFIVLKVINNKFGAQVINSFEFVHLEMNQTIVSYQEPIIELGSLRYVVELNGKKCLVFFKDVEKIF